LYWMRLGMFPMYAIVLVCVYALGRALFDGRVAPWATLLAALWPQNFLTSIEFRTDDLWTALWMLAVATVSSRGSTRKAALLAGLIFGAAFGVSMKTSLLLAAFAGAALGTMFLGRRARVSDPAAAGPRESAARAALFVGGLLVAPGALASY